MECGEIVKRDSRDYQVVCMGILGNECQSDKDCATELNNKCYDWWYTDWGSAGFKCAPTGKCDTDISYEEEEYKIVCKGITGDECKTDMDCD